MRDRNGKFTNVDKERAKARLYWRKGFEQGYAYATGRSFGYGSPSFQGRFAGPFSYGLQRGKSAGVAAREAGVDLSAVEV